jgi:S-adenosylmethionine synthetase
MKNPERQRPLVGQTDAVTSESVTEGHPDKICDLIADAVLDAHLAQDPFARVACDVLAKGDHLVLAGEITSRADVDYEALARNVVDEIGCTDPDQPFRTDRLKVHSLLTEQSPEVGRSVTATTNRFGEQGAGDQGIVIGYATDETPELMPLPILLAHRLAGALAAHRHRGSVDWLRPDGKSQVSVVYAGERPVAVSDVVVSAQHRKEIDQARIHEFVATTLIPDVLGPWWDDKTRLWVNPAGTFVRGGPWADGGLTGRKNIADTYGGIARHGGGALSGKDPSKVDRSGAYFCRYVARQVVMAGLARKVEIQVAYSIGIADPLTLRVDTLGTGDEADVRAFAAGFDFRPAAMIERLDLLRPLYRETTNYGHFGKPWLPWER